MTTIADVRGQMATILGSNVTGMHGGFAYLADTLVNLPAAHVARPGYDPRLVFGGTKQAYKFQVFVYAPRTLDRQVQILLDTFAEPSGATSVTAALQNDANWGSVTVHYAEVTFIGPIKETEIAGVPYFVVAFDVEVVW